METLKTPYVILDGPEPIAKADTWAHADTLVRRLELQGYYRGLTIEFDPEGKFEREYLSNERDN